MLEQVTSFGDLVQPSSHRAAPVKPIRICPQDFSRVLGPGAVSSFRWWSSGNLQYLSSRSAAFSSTSILIGVRFASITAAADGLPGGVPVISLAALLLPVSSVSSAVFERNSPQISERTDHRASRRPCRAVTSRSQGCPSLCLLVHGGFVSFCCMEDLYLFRHLRGMLVELHLCVLMQSKNFDVFGSECPGSSGLYTFSQLFPVGQGKRQVPRSSPWRGELHKLLTRRAEARRTADFATVLPDDIEMVKSSANCYAYTPGVELRILSGAKKRSRERANLRDTFLERPEAADGVVPTDRRLFVSKKSSTPAESSWVDLEAGEVAEEAVFTNSEPFSDRP